MTRQQSQAGQNVGQRRTWGATSLPDYTQRISQRMTREEAVKAVVRMMSAYPSFRCPEESMLTLAEVLLQFPLETAMAAASPIHGAPKKYRDYPLNAGQLTDWCHNAAEPLHQEARLERARLPAPRIPRPTQAELDAQFERLGLAHLRPGSKFGPRPSRFPDNEVRDAQSTLDRYKQEASKGTEE